MLIILCYLMCVTGGMNGLQSMMRQFQQGAGGKMGNMANMFGDRWSTLDHVMDMLIICYWFIVFIRICGRVKASFVINLMQMCQPKKNHFRDIATIYWDIQIQYKMVTNLATIKYSWLIWMFINFCLGAWCFSVRSIE